jgi:Na+/H+ antiporter NhaD/arsenite permease-like protein
LFTGIFATMIPALQLIAEFSSSANGNELFSAVNLYWLTGSLSATLDNAPTYISFLTASVARQGLQVDQFADIRYFSQHHIADLAAISMSAVFFGAMTYIGNAPNFMVKSIAEQQRIKMPSFGAYLWKFSLPYLLPVLFLVWLLLVWLPTVI